MSNTAHTDHLQVVIKELPLFSHIRPSDSHSNAALIFGMSIMIPVAVVIVNYNTREHLRACLATIQSEAPFEVIVVDNASSDHSVEMVRTNYPWVVLHANETNLGYGAAANQAIASCTAKYVLLLNSDILMPPGALQALSTYLDQHPRAAIVGPRLENLDGSLQASCFQFPGTFMWLLDNDDLRPLIRRLPFCHNRFLRTWSYTHNRRVPWVKGAALVIRRKAFEAVSGFDESFFMYFEEADLCCRLQTIGWEVHFTPVTTILHIGEVSTRQYRTDMTVQFIVSRMLFFQRHYSGMRLAALSISMVSIVRARLFRDTVRFFMTRDAAKRTRIAADIAAWQRVLHWYRHEAVRHS